MVEIYVRPEILAEDCASCGVQAGETCLTPAGKQTTPHKPRIEAWKKTRAPITFSESNFAPEVVPDWEAFRDELVNLVARHNLPTQSSFVKDLFHPIRHMGLEGHPFHRGLNPDHHRIREVAMERWEARKRLGFPILDYVSVQKNEFTPILDEIDRHKGTNRHQTPAVSVKKDWYIHVLKPHGKNPNARKPTDGSLSRFELYGSVGNRIKVSDWIALGGKQDDLKWDVRDEIIEVIEA